MGEGFSCSESGFIAAMFDLLVDTIEGFAESGGRAHSRGYNFRELGPEQSGMRAVEEHRQPQALAGHFIAMCSWNPDDHAVQPQTTKVVGHFAGR